MRTRALNVLRPEMTLSYYRRIQAMRRLNQAATEAALDQARRRIERQRAYFEILAKPTPPASILYDDGEIPLQEAVDIM